MKKFVDFYLEETEGVEFHYERFSDTRALNYNVTVKFINQEEPNTFTYPAFEFVGQILYMFLSGDYELIETKQLDSYYPPPLNDRIEIWRKKTDG